MIGLEEEMKGLIAKYLQDKFYSLECKVYKTHEALKEEINKKQFCENALLIAATDSTIALGKEFGIATMAYANPNIPNHSYSGVQMLVEGFEEIDVDFLEKVYQRHHNLPWTILTTNRCVVREFQLSDLDKLFELYSDEEMAKYSTPLLPYEEEKEFQRAYIENMYRYFGYGLWLVFSKDTGELIGRMGLEHREYHGEIELELGYMLSAKVRGMGLAEEVCKEILAYAKENTYFERIHTFIEDGNFSSEKLARKLGFEHKEDYVLDGKKIHRYCKML